MFTFTYKKIDFSHKLGTASFPDDDFGKHIHYVYEIVYFMQGDVTYTVDNESRKLSEGNLILIQPGKVHFATVNDNESYERYVLKFPDIILPDFLKNKLEKFGSFFVNTKNLNYDFARLDDYFNRFNEEEIYALFICEVIKICISLNGDDNSNNLSNNEFIKMVVQYIDSNLDKKITLKSLSNEFHYSTSYISNEFKKNMRISIMQYIKTKKIFLAHQLILNGEKKNMVAKKLGFDDYSTFYRSYIKIMGFAPNNEGE